jgi:antitoxin YefM
MAIQTTYTRARAHLAELWDRAVEDRETILIERRGSEAVVLIAADELASLFETAHLLRSPANAERLLRALERARQGTESPATVEALQRDLGLAEGG